MEIANVDIRAFEPQDWDAICAVHDSAAVSELVLAGADARAFRPMPEEEDKTKFLEMNSALLACLDGVVVGFVAWRDRGEWQGSGYLSWLYVDPAHHRRGVGDQLLTRAMASLGRAGTKQVPDLRGGEAAGMARVAVEELNAATVGSLILRVLREADDRPLEHVGVHLTPRGQDSLTSLRQASTGSDGTARFEDLPLGDVQVVLDRGPREVVTIRAGKTPTLSM